MVESTSTLALSSHNRGTCSLRDARVQQATGPGRAAFVLPWESVGRVLAVRLDNVGDVVLLGPALRALRAALPRAHVTLLASPAGASVAPLLPWVDDVMVEQVVWQDTKGAMPLDPARELALVSRLAEHRFDAALIFTSWAQSPWPPAYACYLAGIPVRIGESKEFGGALLTTAVPSRPDGLHQADRNLHLLETTGIPAAGRHLELHVPRAVQEAADGLLVEAGVDPGRPFVVVAPGASCAARRWFPERFADVVAALAGDHGLPVVVAASAKEAELVEPVVERSAGLPVAALVGRTSVPELAAVVARATLVVCNDSGPMHLAEALGRPLVVLYSGTELESQWGPRFAPHVLLRRPTPCSPCHRFDCPYDLACLDYSPAEVVDRCLRLLDAGAPATARAGAR